MPVKETRKINGTLYALINGKYVLIDKIPELNNISEETESRGVSYQDSFTFEFEPKYVLVEEDK